MSRRQFKQAGRQRQQRWRFGFSWILIIKASATQPSRAEPRQRREWDWDGEREIHPSQFLFYYFLVRRRENLQEFSSYKKEPSWMEWSEGVISTEKNERKESIIKISFSSFCQWKEKCLNFDWDSFLLYNFTISFAEHAVWREIEWEREYSISRNAWLSRTFCTALN